MASAQSCNELLHNLLIVGFRERAHVFEISRRQSGHAREVSTQILSKPTMTRDPQPCCDCRSKSRPMLQ